MKLVVEYKVETEITPNISDPDINKRNFKRILEHGKMVREFENGKSLDELRIKYSKKDWFYDHNPLELLSLEEDQDYWFIKLASWLTGKGKPFRIKEILYDKSNVVTEKTF